MVLKMSKSPANRKTMQQEIKTMYNLEHPNLLRQVLYITFVMPLQTGQ